MDKSLGGYWEFPGGKIESNETPDIALKRELSEELGMEVAVQNEITTIIHSYKTFTIKLKAIKCAFLSASFIMTDHDKYEWVEPRDLLNWKLADADKPIVKFLNN